MEDDLETEDMNPELAALSVNYPELAGKSPSEMQRAFLPMYLGAVESERAAREKSATALKDRYEAARAEIEQQRFGAPTTSQQLAALSQALLAPRRMRGFAGTLANIMPAITEPADLRAAAETKREAALRQLREQYATAADASAVGTAAAKREALAKVLPLMKPSSGAGYTYMPDRGGYGPQPGVGGNPQFPNMDDYGNYVVTDKRQIVYLPPNSPIVLPGGDPMKPKYTPAIPSR
jgi:hypothetical protein